MLDVVTLSVVIKASMLFCVILSVANKPVLFCIIIMCLLLDFIMLSFAIKPLFTILSAIAPIIITND